MTEPERGEQIVAVLVEIDHDLIAMDDDMSVGRERIELDAEQRMASDERGDGPQLSETGSELPHERRLNLRVLGVAHWPWIPVRRGGVDARAARGGKRLQRERHHEQTGSLLHDRESNGCRLLNRRETRVPWNVIHVMSDLGEYRVPRGVFMRYDLERQASCLREE